MSFTKPILAISCLLLAAPASAQLDPDPDGLGVYFDPAATEVAAQIVVGETVPAYLVLTRPSQPGTLALWEASVGPTSFNATSTTVRTRSCSRRPATRRCRSR